MPSSLRRLARAPGGRAAAGLLSLMMHNVTADKGQFHAGDIAPEQTGKITIDKQGRFPYVFTLHPGMKGLITVK